jgi:arsenite-transporting ATPase
MGGLDLLRKLGNELFGDEDPAKHLYEGETQSLETDGSGGYVMRIPLPLADRANVDLYRAPDELTLSVGAYRRNIALPRIVWPLEVESAKLKDGILTLHFSAATEAAGQA